MSDRSSPVRPNGSHVWRFSLVRYRDLGSELCALSRRAFDVQPAAERFDAIGEAAEA